MSEGRKTIHWKRAKKWIYIIEKFSRNAPIIINNNPTHGISKLIQRSRKPNNLDRNVVHNEKLKNLQCEIMKTKRHAAHMGDNSRVFVIRSSFGSITSRRPPSLGPRIKTLVSGGIRVYCLLKRSEFFLYLLLRRNSQGLDWLRCEFWKNRVQSQFSREHVRWKWLAFCCCYSNARHKYNIL